MEINCLKDLTVNLKFKASIINVQVTKKYDSGKTPLINS